jgi:hypothetical protein
LFFAHIFELNFIPKSGNPAGTAPFGTAEKQRLPLFNAESNAVPIFIITNFCQQAKFSLSSKDQKIN